MLGLLCVYGSWIGAALADDPASLLHEYTLRVDGTDRSYFYYQPPATVGRSKPLVIVFHGGLGSGLKVAKQSDFTRVAARHGFAVAFPNSSGYWHDRRSTVGAGAADLDFIRSLVKRLVRQRHVDPRRVYATGVSNGGIFTLRLACEMSDTFAAFAPVAASFPVAYYPSCQPARPVPIIMFNGTADRFIQWNGGAIRKGRFRGAGGEVIPVPETLQSWRRDDGCSPDPSTRYLPNTHPGDPTSVSVLTYRQCRDGDLVKLVKIDGGGHAWPGSHAHRGFWARRLMGQVTREIDASEAIWAFFKHYRLPVRGRYGIASPAGDLSRFCVVCPTSRRLVGQAGPRRHSGDRACGCFMPWRYTACRFCDKRLLASYVSC